MINDIKKTEISETLKNRINLMLGNIKNAFQTGFGGNLTAEEELELEDKNTELEKIVQNIVITRELDSTGQYQTWTIPEGGDCNVAFYKNQYTTYVLPSTTTNISRYNILNVGTATGPWTLVIKATTPPTISNYGTTTKYATIGSPEIIKVPASAVDTYKSNSDWSDMASYILAIDD